MYRCMYFYEFVKKLCNKIKMPKRDVLLVPLKFDTAVTAYKLHSKFEIDCFDMWVTCPYFDM